MFRSYFRALLALIAAIAGLATAAEVAAAVPAAIAVTGLIVAQSGGPVADGDYALTFRLYAGEKEVKPGWKEGPVVVTVKGGLFNLGLGSEVALTPAVLGAMPEVWLGVTVGNEPELARKPVLSAPLAIRAAIAENLDCSGCISAGHLDPKALAGYVKTGDLQGFAKTADLGEYAKAGSLAPVAASGLYTDLKAIPTFADVAKTGAYGDLAGTPVLAKVGVACGTGLVVKGIKADGALDCVAGGVTAANLPADGLDEVSNGLLKNQYTESAASTTVPLAIPDFSGVGINDKIEVPDFGVAEGLAVSITVTNSDISKVRIDLHDPTGAKTTIYDGEQTGKKLTLQLITPNVKALDGWIGKNPKGTWSLVVADLSNTGGGKDGTLDAWSVQVKTLSNKKVSAFGALQLMVTDVAPIPCNNSHFGAMYASPKELAVLVCNGKDWVPFQLVQVGSQENPAASCKDVLTKLPSSKDGDYWLKTSAGPAKYFCDMVSDGGGWTRIAVEATADATGWSDGTLTNATVGGTATQVHGVWGTGGGASKTFDFKAIPHTQARVGGRYYAIDSWDNEANGAQVYLDGALKFGASKSYGGAGSGAGWVTASFTPAPWGNNSGPNGYWTIETALGLVDHLAGALKLDFKTGIDQDKTDESFAFSHVQVWIR
ncbi:MAG: hypothetical protein EXR77_10770 [Myxococcales bacterium]|nr:hypothetical protein [Myxococcales bacterium]